MTDDTRTPEDGDADEPDGRSAENEDRTAATPEAGTTAASGSTAKTPPRRWWQQQRWIVVVAVIILVLAIVGVTLFLTSEAQETAVGPEGEPLPSPTPSQPADGAQSEPASQQEQGSGEDGQGQNDGQGGEQQQDQATAQVCDRIIAFQDDLRDGGFNPLEILNDLSEIEQQARGTPLADQVNDAAEVAEGLFTGDATFDDVVDTVNNLASAC